MRPAVDIAAGDQNVVTPQYVRQHGVDGRHAAVEIPSEVITRLRSGFDFDDLIRQRHRRRVQQSRVDFEQQLFALKGIFDPFGTGVDVRRRAGDNGVGREQRRDVVEDGVRSLGRDGRRAVAEPLVRTARGVLQRIEQLGQLK